MLPESSVLSSQLRRAFEEYENAVPRSELRSNEPEMETHKDHRPQQMSPQSRVDQPTADATHSSESNGKGFSTSRPLESSESIVPSVLNGTAATSRRLASGEPEEEQLPDSVTDGHQDRQLALPQRYVDSHFRLLDSVLRLLNSVVHNTQLYAKGPKPIDVQEQDSELPAPPLGVLKNMIYPRLAKNQLSEHNIEEWMFELETTAIEISDLISEELPTIDLSISLKGECNSDLAKLLGIVCGRNKFDGELIRGEYITRSLVAAAVSEWIFNDIFPNIEESDHWDAFETLLAERALTAGVGDDATTFLEEYRKDIIYRLSNKPKLLNIDLPARATELAKRLAVVIETLVAQQKESREVKCLSEKIAQGRKSWIGGIEKLFLSALKFVVRLRQIKNNMIMQWPKKGETFDCSSKMRILDSGPRNSFQSHEIVLTVMPAAIVEGTGRSYPKTKYEAIVYLNILNDASTPIANLTGRVAAKKSGNQRSGTFVTNDKETERDATGHGLSHQSENAKLHSEKYRSLEPKRHFEKIDGAGSPSQNPKRQKVTPGHKVVAEQGTVAPQLQCGNCCTTKAKEWSNGLCRPCNDFWRSKGTTRPVGGYCEKCNIAKIALTKWWELHGKPNMCMSCYKATPARSESKISPSQKATWARSKSRILPSQKASPARSESKIPSSQGRERSSNKRFYKGAPFPCVKCKKSFSNKGLLARHQKACFRKSQVHTEDGIDGMVAAVQGTQEDVKTGDDESGEDDGGEDDGGEDDGDDDDSNNDDSNDDDSNDDDSDDYDETDEQTITGGEMGMESATVEAEQASSNEDADIDENEVDMVRDWSE